MMTLNERTALHEAAHAVVAHTNGLTVTSIEITNHGTGLCMMAGTAGQEKLLGMAGLAGYVVEAMLEDEANKETVTLSVTAMKANRRYGTDYSIAHEAFGSDDGLQARMNAVRETLLECWDTMEDVAMALEDNNSLKGVKLYKLLQG